MDVSLKRKYPFRLGTTSFIYPDSYASNVRKLAPFLDEIELLLFESNHLPSRSEVDELGVLAQSHDITYNVHLPMDIDLAADASETRQQSIESIAKAIDRIAPLNPTTHTLHLTFNRTHKTKESVDVWRSHALQSMTLLLKTSGLAADRISIETLDFSPFWLNPIVEGLDLAVCVDVGHVILHGFDLRKVLNSFETRTTILHLHGVSACRDHLSLRHFEPDDRNIISRYLQKFKGSVSIEVFNLEGLRESMACFPGLIRFAKDEIGS